MTCSLALKALALTFGLAAIVILPAEAQTADSRATSATPTSYVVPGGTAGQTAQQAPHGQDLPTAQMAAKPVKPVKAKKKKRVKPPKPVRASIERGTLTVDGLTCKAALNYHIADMHYLYMYVPGSGTIVVSRSRFPGAQEQRNAFHGQGLSVEADGHLAELYSEGVLISKKPASAWVRLDRSYRMASGYPVFGYGESTAAPYTWPRTSQAPPEEGVAYAPPLPRSMLQTYSPQVVPVALTTSSRQAAPGRSPKPSEGTQY